MKKDNIIKLIKYINQLGNLSISLSVLFFTFYLIRGVNIFTNSDRLLFLLGIQIFVIVICKFLLKKISCPDSADTPDGADMSIK